MAKDGPVQQKKGEARRRAPRPPGRKGVVVVSAERGAGRGNDTQLAKFPTVPAQGGGRRMQRGPRSRGTEGRAAFQKEQPFRKEEGRWASSWTTGTRGFQV